MARFADAGSAEELHSGFSAGSVTLPSTDSFELDAIEQPQVVKAAQTTIGVQASFGQWSDVVAWPLVAIHANLLPNGKVLLWDATPDDSDDDPHTTSSFSTRVSLWDPKSGVHIATNNDTNSDLFCAGSAHLWDGKILFAGGDSGTNGDNGPLENTSVYDPDSNTWRRVSNMATPRWYASVAALSNGEMLTFAGTYSPEPIAEVYQIDETWRPLPLNLPYEFPGDYQWMQATPEGNVISFGPQNTIGTIDTNGDGLWTTGPQRDEIDHRTYGSYAMFDIGMILVSGGGDQSSESAVVINTLTQQTQSTGSMNFGRTQHNLTILADGSVLATGGNYDGTYLINPDTGVYTPEIWSPDNGNWSVMNDMQVNRQYHSTALLLPDGRVLSAGGGICGDCSAVGYLEQNAEIFSPPYLFSSGNTIAIRPRITSGPTEIDYQRDFSVTASSSANIQKAHLIKLGAVTHSQNQDQRLVPLSFQRSGSTLILQSPPNRDIAPPGHYMLFVVDDSGVPSIGEIIKVGQPLLDSNSRVSNMIRAGKSESYVIESSRLDTSLTVRLEGLNANTTLSVRKGADIDNAAQICQVASAAKPFAECTLPNREASRWYIEVIGVGGDTPYNLTAALGSRIDEGYNYPLTSGATLDDRVEFEGWNFYSVSVPVTETDLVVELTNLTGDNDLYVREAQRPSGTSDNSGFFNCASYRANRNDEYCRIENASGKTWIVGVYGYLGAEYSLKTHFNYRTPAISEISLGVQRMSLVANSWRYFKLSASAFSGNLAIQLSGLSDDADLYVNAHSVAERSIEQWGDVDCASYAGGSKNEYCQMPHQQADVFIGVYAHRATSATLTISASNSDYENQSENSRVGKSALIAIKNTDADGGTVVEVDNYTGESVTAETQGSDGSIGVRSGSGSAGVPLLLFLIVIGVLRISVKLWCAPKLDATGVAQPMIVYN